MRGKGDLFRHLITGEFYQMKEIGGEKVILECISEPNRWWIGEEEEVCSVFQAIRRDEIKVRKGEKSHDSLFGRPIEE